MVIFCVLILQWLILSYSPLRRYVLNVSELVKMLQKRLINASRLELFSIGLAHEDLTFGRDRENLSPSPLAPL